MTDITVPVPEERTAEFYQFFGHWLAGSLSLPGTPSRATEGSQETPKLPWSGTDQDSDDAETLWRRYSATARALFSLLMDSPGTAYTGEQIAQKLNITHGSRGVAGVLAWPGRYAVELGREQPWYWRWDQATQESFYWIPAELAELFTTVRSRVEGSR